MAVALLVAEHTERITVRTSVALAFTRSPTLLAYAAWDISKLSGGRFQLGLGTQIRQNIEDRYGVPFGEDPIGRLGDYVGAVRAAFASFASGEPPAYREPALPRHPAAALLQPRARRETVAPPIYLGGVQRRACALAGAVADGFVSHPTNSNPRYLRETCLPALAEGARAAGRDLGSAGFETVIGTPVITGASADAVLAERERQRRLLAFLYSTPAYAPTLELYGWGELGPRLRELIRRDRWDDLAGVLSDEVLDTLVPCGTFDELPGMLLERFAGLGQGIVVSAPADTGDDDGFPSGHRRRCRRPEPAASRQRGIGKMSSSSAMASTAARRCVVAHGRGALGGGQHAGQQRDVAGVQNAWTPGVESAKRTPRSMLLVGGRRLVPRRRPPLRGGGAPGDRVGQRTTVRPGPPRHRLDRHDADVALGAEGQELLGRLAVLGAGPQGGIDGEHHRVEVEPPQRLEVRRRHLEVVARDAGEAGLPAVAELQDPLERRRAAVELLQRRDARGPGRGRAPRR